MTQKLTELFISMWEQESIPQEMEDATIVHLYKKKGKRQSCDNHRGIAWYSRHDFHSTPTARKVPETTPNPVQDICGSKKSLRHYLS